MLGDGVRLEKEAGEVTVQPMGTRSTYYVTFTGAIPTYVPGTLLSTLVLTHLILTQHSSRGVFVLLPFTAEET